MQKYKNKKVEYDGIMFDSTAERDFYLFLLKKHRKDDIIVQPSYTLLEAFRDSEGKLVRAITYKGDFEVLGTVYDVKGMLLPIFAIKEKLFKHKFKDKKLICVCKAPRYTGHDWIELSELKKLRKDRKARGI